VSVRLEVRLWAAQRATAAVLAVCVAVHLVTIIYAVRGGLTAAEILSRTHGSIAWAAFYAAFVLAAAIHAAVGLRNILAEWVGWRGAGAGVAVAAFALLLVATGLRAVWAVFA
jgi:fumarate reductase subunit C